MRLKILVSGLCAGLGLVSTQSVLAQPARDWRVLTVPTLEGTTPDSLFIFSTHPSGWFSGAGELPDADGLNIERYAWVFSESSGLQRLGFTDAEHTDAASQGYVRISDARRIAPGIVAGTSSRAPFETGGRTAWVWREGHGTTRVGPTGPEVVGPDGVQFVSPSRVSAFGVAGQAVANAGVPDTESSYWAWVQPFESEAQHIGLFEAPYIADDGSELAYVYQMTDAGHVLGEMWFRTGTQGPMDGTAWLWTPALGTTKLGFTDAEHTSPQGYHYSLPRSMNEDGLAVGTSARFANGIYTGVSAWAQRAGEAPVRIDPALPNHLQSFVNVNHVSNRGQIYGSSGGQKVWTWKANEGSRVIGPATPAGNDSFWRAAEDYVVGLRGSINRLVWLWSPNRGARFIGPSGAQYTSTNGEKQTSVYQVNEGGKVVGSSARYSGNTIIAYDLWIHEGRTDQLTIVPLPVGANELARIVGTQLVSTGAVVFRSDIYQGQTYARSEFYVWSADVGLTRLEDRIDPPGPSLPIEVLRSVGPYVYPSFGDNRILVSPRICDSIDFNADLSLFDPQDIEAFFSVYSEGPCIPADAPCGDVDFNNDGSIFDPADIHSFLSVYSEGPC